MAFEVRLAIGLAIAIAVTFLVTPLAVRAAGRFGFYDVPAGYKGHARPTPYLGGAAVTAGFLLAVTLTGDAARALPLAAGVVLLWAVGTVDDRRTVVPMLRIGIESALAALLWGLGLGWDVTGIAPADLLLTIGWVVAVVNAFNLFDNMDGTASTMAVVICCGLAVLGLTQGDHWLVIAAAALGGACLGFLPHNIGSPDRIFLGDGGSMPIGFGVAALTMIGTTDAFDGVSTLVVALMLVGVPILDTSLVIVSRTRRGISVLTGGRDHLTHRTRLRVGSVTSVALVLGAAQALLTGLALLAVEGGETGVAAAAAAYVVAVGTVIAVLDRDYIDDRAAPVSDTTGTGGGGAPEWLAVGLLAPLGIAAGLSPFFSGFYATSVWVPIAIGLLVVFTASLLARPLRLTLPAGLALGGLAGLAAWSLLSAAWGESSTQAVIEANRWVFYAALLGTLVLLVRTPKQAIWLVALTAGACLATVLVEVARLLGSDAGSMFVGGRLNEPLGYINGLASFFVVSFWFFLAAAEQRRSALLGALGAGAATLAAGLALLCQSRGAGLALGASVLLCMALLPGRRRRAFALLVIGGGFAIAAPGLLDVLPAASPSPPAEIVNDAAGTLLLAAVIVGFVWGVIATVFERSIAPQPERAQRARLASSVALGGLVLVGVVVALTSTARISNFTSTQWDAFIHLEASGNVSGEASSTRLTSGAGNRYDYWRIAWDAWRDKPIVGLGAGNYEPTYFANRRTTEDIQQAHSIEFQTLSETGIVGGALVLVLLGGIVLGAVRMRQATARAGPARSLAVVGVGVTTVWVAHMSVDWIHLLPGITALALIAAAPLLQSYGQAAQAPQVPPRRSPSPGVAALGVIGLLLAIGALSLVRQGLAERDRVQSQQALAADPAEALRLADRSLRIDGSAVPTWYARAAALARFNRAEEARAALLEAIDREPRNFVTWTLLGDLSVRSGQLGKARAAYRRASQLNPRDPELRRLAVDPAAAAPVQ